MHDQTNSPQDTNALTEIPQETRVFLESLLEDTHMQFIDPGEKEEILVQLYIKLDYYLTAKIVEALPEEALDEFTRMNEEHKSREDVEAFIMEKVPNAQDLFRKAFVEFRDLYVGASTTSMEESAVETNPLMSQSSETEEILPPLPAPIASEEEY